MTPEQLAVLKADIQAEHLAQFQLGQYNLIANFYNAPTSFIVWKSSVNLDEVGSAFNATGLAAMTSLNNDRLVSFALYNSTVKPSRLDHRQFFDDVFSPASGASTRTALLALWKRPARFIEQMFATGVGTDGSPATLVFEGTISGQTVIEAMAS